MKELVFSRLLIPATERWSDRVGFHDGDYHATFAAAPRPRAAARRRAARPARASSRGDRFAVMALNSHQFLELYHAGVPRRRRHQPAEPAPRAEGARVHPRRLGHEGRASPTRSSRPSSTRCARDVGIEHVVLIGDGDVPHDVDVRGAARGGDAGDPRRARRGRPGRSSCTPAARPACPRACCSTSAPRCSTCTTSPSAWRFDDDRRVPAPDADVPRRVDGRRCSACPAQRRRVGVRAAVRPGARCSTRSSSTSVDDDGDGADDDRMLLDASRRSGPSGSRRCGRSTYGASPMPAALLDQLLDDVPRRSTSSRATA